MKLRQFCFEVSRVLDGLTTGLPHDVAGGMASVREDLRRAAESLDPNDEEYVIDEVAGLLRIAGTRLILHIESRANCDAALNYSKAKELRAMAIALLPKGVPLLPGLFNRPFCGSLRKAGHFAHTAARDQQVVGGILNALQELKQERCPTETMLRRWRNICGRVAGHYGRLLELRQLVGETLPDVPPPLLVRGAEIAVLISDLRRVETFWTPESTSLKTS
jgi:hypothetical protein